MMCGSDVVMLQLKESGANPFIYGRGQGTDAVEML